jgi:N-ethylmaleimide reductase
MTDLFDRFDLHGIILPNRILMSPMTRTRATEDDVPTDLMRDYYVQRASAGLIITECTQVSDQAHGIHCAPGIHRADQVVAWKRVVDGVHAAGGRIYCQLWHCGRVAHPAMRGGDLPVAPSPIAAQGDFHLPSGRVAFPVPRELALGEINGIIEDFAAATGNARQAGFDGVELHGAFGYLQDQFLQDGSNQRGDAYGGSVSNRARFLLETVEAMIGAWSRERVGVRLSPSSRFYGMFDSDARATFGHAIAALDALRVGYLHLREPSALDLESGTVQIERVAETFRSRVSVPLIVNTGFDKGKAQAVVAAGTADLVAFGTLFLANPDLPARFRSDASLNAPDRSTFYGAGAKGYSDYPTLGDVHHPLSAGDAGFMAALRPAVVAAKGKLERPAFDEVMEHTPDAPGVAYQEGVVGGVNGVWCRPLGARAGASILHVHGGAYIVGSAHAYRHFVGQVASRARMNAFIPEYRLAPEHVFPAAVEDAMAVYRALAELGEVAVAGDSAGGGLALVLLALVQAEGGRAPFAGALLSPWTDLALTGASLDERANDDPFLTRAALAAAATSYLQGHDARDGLASPLYGPVAHLPPLQLHVGSAEVLLDDSRRYVERARAAGTDAVLHTWEGMPHVFASNVGTLEAADLALNLVATFLVEHFTHAVQK